MTARAKAILNLVTAQVTKDVRKNAKKLTRKTVCGCLDGIVVDLSQNPDRRAFTGTSGCLRTLCTSSRLVDLGRGRLVRAPEYLWLQGHNRITTTIPEGMSGSSVRALAGEGMALPCLGLCQWALFLAKQFPRNMEEPL